MRDPQELLRKHGVSITAQRIAVLKAVSERPHSTAENITEFVRNQIGAVSKQTVYDTLALLNDKRLIRRIQPSGSPALYEDRVNDNHHHMICRSCSKTVDIDCAVGKSPCLTPNNDHGYKIDEAEVIYWGLCPNCSDQNNLTAVQ